MAPTVEPLGRDRGRGGDGQRAGVGLARLGRRWSCRLHAAASGAARRWWRRWRWLVERERAHRARGADRVRASQAYAAALEVGRPGVDALDLDDANSRPHTEPPDERSN